MTGRIMGYHALRRHFPMGHNQEVRIWLFLQFCLFLALIHWASGWGAEAIAGVITIETHNSVEVTGDQINITVTTVNKGSESALNLQTHLILLGKQEEGPVIQRIDPGQSESCTFKMTLTGVKKGRHPLIVFVDFHDTNQYPFSAFSGMTFHFEKDANADLVCMAKDTSIKESGVVNFNIKNLASESRKIHASLVLPKEFSTPKSKIEQTLDPRAEKLFSFQVMNFSALQGAAYPVFCFFEYDLNNIHYTAVANALVKVTKEGNLFRQTRWLWITTAAVLGLALLVTILKKR